MSHKPKFIVKVQVPLESSEPDPHILIYNEDKSIFETFPMTDEMHEAFTEPKSFQFARLRKDGMLVLCGEAPWQDW